MRGYHRAGRPCPCGQAPSGTVGETDGGRPREDLASSGQQLNVDGRFVGSAGLGRWRIGGLHFRTLRIGGATDEQSPERVTAALKQLMAEHRLFGDTRLYREAMCDALQPTDEAGVFTLAANSRPSESVVDVYGRGYVVQAERVGPGLAFEQTDAPNWQETMEMRTLKARRGTGQPIPADRVEVEVRLHDILSQGGLPYPVESVTVERAWYCTLPGGSIAVRTVT